MRVPTLRGVIHRRILVNYRVEAAALARLVPAPLRPKLLHGKGMAGICLIRLEGVRPRGFPAFLGLSSENAAHRIAVEWDHEGGVREGVYIPRRDTSSRLNALAGGRIFPGEHHHARFDVVDRDDRISLRMTSDDGRADLSVRGRTAAALPATSIFGTIDEASRFFERGSLGYSVTSWSI